MSTSIQSTINSKVKKKKIMCQLTREAGNHQLDLSRKKYVFMHM